MPRVTHYATKEGEDWRPFFKPLPYFLLEKSKDGYYMEGNKVHALRFENGEEWDELNGVRNPMFVVDPTGREATQIIRTFSTGATRDTNQDKPDYEGFLSPIVLEDFANYMHGKRVQQDGALRDSDNWQKGIPINEYMKSLYRHFMHLWLLHRGYTAKDEKGNEVTLRDTLCGIEFNTMGYHFEVLKNELLHNGKTNPEQ